MDDRIFATNLKNLTKCAQSNYGNRVAFSYRKGKKEIAEKTYTEFQNDINGFGTYLYKNDLCNEKIAIIGDNSYEWIVSYFAVVQGGNVAVPIDKNLPYKDIIYILENSNCKAIVYGPDYEEIVKKIKQNLSSIKFLTNMGRLEAYINEGSEEIKKGNLEFVDKEISDDSEAMLVYTSGTTGKSKGVLLTHRNLALDAYSTGANLKIEGDTILFLPLHHSFGLVAGVLMVIDVGRRIHINHNFRNVCEEFQIIRPKLVFLVPVIVEQFYKNIWKDLKKSGLEEKYRKLIEYSNDQLAKGNDERRELFKSILEQFGGELRTICCGGAPLSEVYVKGYRELGINLINGYGISECSPVVSVNKNDYYRDGSVGQIINCCKVKIQDENEDGIGLILVKGDNIMKGYYKNEEETKKVLSEDGWFNTGDLGRIDEDGFLFITGRAKNIIVLSNGENVQAEELEDKLQKITNVKEVIVYGENDILTAELFLEDPSYEEEVKNEILALNADLPLFKRIKKTKIRYKEFEKTATKKIKRRK
ncbi:AMP-binding protein [uncultured Clostridium sp.]|uniref:AMP-binding protein n=1 Tax=uncultured Clostridium sp. TaxID=59620 RepID=UPI0025DBA911|nr:AMP-binding protein [uncultured Clostridium sp.]